MLPIKLAVLLFCCISFSPAEELEAKPTDAKVEAVETTKLTPSVEESKSKTEKRDSSDQTGTVFISNPTKETAFRPIYPAATYYAAPAESDAIFEPTTVRYTAADAAAAAAPQQQQQAFYGKSEGGSIRFGEQRHGAVRSSLPGPLRLSQHQQQQQQQQQQHHAAPPHRFSYAVQPQVELYQRPIAKQHAPIYNYVEAEPSMYERLAPQQYQLGGASTAAAAAASLPGHRVQYIIAIPLSYMRQLQQQLGGNLLQVPSSPAPSSSSSSTTTTSTSTTTSTAAPPSTPESAIASASHPIVQLLGPLARDQPSVYHRHQYYPAEGPTAASPYAQQYLQIPASVLLAATQQLQQHHQQHQQQQQQQHQQQQQQQPQTYAKVAPTTSPVYQPFIYQSQPQFQLPRLYPAAPMIYTEQPVAQQTTLYAYPLAQQQQHHHHQQQHQQQPARLVRLGPKHGQQQHKYAAVPLAATASSVSSAPVTTATTTTATAATLVLPTATTATHEAVQQQQQQQQQQPHHSLPIVHYNPIYVQAPAEQQQQQQQQQQHQFAILPRFSNNNPKAGYNLAHESTPPIHVVRLSAANALGQHQQPIHHYHHYQPAMAQQQQQQHPHLYQPHALPVGNYIEEQPQQQHQQHQQQQQQQPALIPYFSHPGAVHYGTHLYHPASVAAVSAAAGTKQLQQQQQPQQQHQQRQASEATATSGRLPGDSGVKQPTAATNIVKYP
ncbi:myb-like protein Q [Drosophila albomicans]|uniref:Myb-like protein Q n=1 Tax=Drosophila albomicans TaxID=7291 RepID=A0A6P8ZFZ4_DROAB|nr:myb-like protein Q [Drosophila albomicans]